MGDSYLVTFGHILLFLFFMGIAWIVNYIAKRPRMNGALFYLVLAAILFVMLVTDLYSETSGIPASSRAYVLGQIVGAMLIPVVVALYYSWRFGKSKGQGGVHQ